MRLHHGDALEILKTIPDNSIDSIVTDPPYGLGKEPDALEMLKDWIKDGHHDVKNKSGFMGKAWDAFVPQPNVWKECLRVLKPGGHLLSFAGTRTQDLISLGLRIAGFEIRDSVAWVYSQGFPKSLDIGKATETPNNQFQGWGTGLKPAHEPIIIARKEIQEDTIVKNVLKYGTGAINIDGCRIPLNGDYKSKPNGRPSLTGLGDNYNPEKANEPDTLGRWPANFCHDGSPDVLELFPETASGKPCGVRKGNNNNIYSNYGGSIPITGFGDNGSAARFFYCAKATAKDRDDGLEEFELKSCGMMEDDNYDIKTGSGKPRNTKRRNTHPCVKPTNLMRWLCRLVTPIGGTVLDPFMGSGSTGKACVLENFDFIGIEKEEAFIEIAEARIRYVQREKHSCQDCNMFGLYKDCDDPDVLPADRLTKVEDNCWRFLCNDCNSGCPLLFR